MRITEKIATIYHTARGIIKMKFSVKHAKFKQNDYLVQTHMRMVITEVETLEQVPNYGNLRAVVQSEVDRINHEWEERKRLREEREKAIKEELETIEKEREGHAE